MTTPLKAFNGAIMALGGYIKTSHKMGITKQALYKQREEMRKDAKADVSPRMAANLAHLCKINNVPFTFTDFCPSIGKAAEGVFPFRYTPMK